MAPLVVAQLLLLPKQMMMVVALRPHLEQEQYSKQKNE
jgi:hypothetical protein